MTATTSPHCAPDGDITHVLQFGPFCGATLLDRARGLGLLVLMTIGECNAGTVSPRRDWAEEGCKNTPPAELAAWVSVRVGYPVTVTRADMLADPTWGGSIAYAVRRQADG